MSAGALPTPAGAAYETRRAWVQEYFDRTAADAWARLTSDAPVGRIRASVRAGRDRMRATLLAWLADDLSGVRILDAGCGTGQLAVDLARRGAHVVAVDLSPTLVELAASRAGEMSLPGRLEFRAGDMLDAGLGRFDHVVAMDSLIHYSASDMVAALAALAPRVRHSILFTFAPRTPLLAAMHAVGRLLPRANRSPSIEPLAERVLRERLAAAPALGGWSVAWTGGVATGFYRSRAVAFVRSRA